MPDSPHPQRNEKGQLVPGAVINPKGNNGHNVGWQRYGDRLQKWLAISGEELETYFLNNGELLKKQSVIDIACIQHARAIIVGKNILGERKEAIDRIEGTPKQTILHGGAPEGAVKVKFTLDFGTDMDDNSPIPATETIPKTE